MELPMTHYKTGNTPKFWDPELDRRVFFSNKQSVSWQPGGLEKEGEEE
jgi:hypothetical protein